MSYTTTAYYTMDTILPCLGYASGDHSKRCYASPSSLRFAGKQSTKVNHLSGCGLFLLYMAHCMIVRPYANSSELSYTTTLSYTTDTILPCFGYASGDHSRGWYAPLSVWQESSPPRLTGLRLWSFPIVYGRLLDIKALQWHPRVVLHHNSILDHEHHPRPNGSSSQLFYKTITLSVNFFLLSFFIFLHF